MPPPVSNEDFEVIDTEEYKSQEQTEFSHQGLVMMAMKKVVEYGCQEMIQGYYANEQDPKTGKTKVVYRQDIRKAFIESVKTLRMIMICDFDDDAKKKLISSEKGDQTREGNIMDKLKDASKKYMEQQKEWWEKSTEGQKRSYTTQGMGVIDGYLNMNLPFYNQFFMEELEIYREIFEELTMLTNRLNFYEGKHYYG